MIDHANTRILITGGHGFLGSHIVDMLQNRYNVPREALCVPIHSEANLKDMETCKRLVHKNNIIIHCAAHVGGIGLLKEKPGEIMYDNVIMGFQLLEAARLEGIKKIVILGTTCSYPSSTPIPTPESSLWDGFPDPVTGYYGLAKKMLFVQADAYRKQYGLHYVGLLPTNIYGPGDNFDLAHSHVAAALIRKFIEAHTQNLPFVTVWGTGVATREFIYVDDVAKTVIESAFHFNNSDIMNIGTGVETSIAVLAHTIKTLVGYEGEIHFDATKPEGNMRRCLDVSKAKKLLGFTALTTLTDGLKTTIAWYRANLL